MSRPRSGRWGVWPPTMTATSTSSIGDSASGMLREFTPCCFSCLAWGVGVGVGGGEAPTRNVSASKCPCDPAVQGSCMFCQSVWLERDVFGV